MTLNRRTFLNNVTALATMGTAGGAIASAGSALAQSGGRMRRIATEEAFAIPEQTEAMREVVENFSGYDPDIYLWEKILAGPVNRPLHDIGEGRIAQMDETGVDMHVLSLTSTGVQMFDADTGTAIAELANDRLAEAVRNHPTRFGGLASFAPQDVTRAVKEIERARTDLKLHGFVVNSHTNGEYLSEEKYWPILEALDALEAPLYIHPRSPGGKHAAAYRADHLEHAIWGYTAETGLHGIKLIMAGIFDRFPNLKIILGHMGENIPFHLYRTDYMYRLTVEMMDRVKLEKRPSDYFRDNFVITTSGVNWHPALKFSVDVLGAENVMWAIDYPYQETPEAVEFMDTAPVSEEQKHLLFHGNAERVFGIEPLI